MLVDWLVGRPLRRYLTAFANKDKDQLCTFDCYQTCTSCTMCHGSSQASVYCLVLRHPHAYSIGRAVSQRSMLDCCSLCRYPQLIQNALLKSVAGISFDFMIYNWLGFLCYSMFNLGLYLNPTIRAAYRFEAQILTAPARFSCHSSVPSLVWRALTLRAHSRG